MAALLDRPLPLWRNLNVKLADNLLRVRGFEFKESTD